MRECDEIDETIPFAAHPGWVQEFALKRAKEQFGRCVFLKSHDSLVSLMVFKETPEGHDVWMAAHRGEYDRLFEAWEKCR